MKKRFKIILGLFMLLFLSFNVFKLVQEDEMIIGVWVEESASFNDRWIIYENGYSEDFDENQIFDTYYWKINEVETPSGILISHLILTNTKDPTDNYHYEINTLNEERLVLVYQRPSGGLGKLTTYFRQ